MTVGELAERIDERELDEWIEYEKHHASRTEQLLAVMCAMFFNSHRDSNRSRALDAGDFLGIPRPPEDPMVVMKKLKMWAMMKGATVPDAHRRI